MVSDVRGMRSLLNSFGEEVIRKISSDLNAVRQPVTVEIARLAEMVRELDSNVKRFCLSRQMVLGRLKRENPKQGVVICWISIYLTPHCNVIPKLSDLSHIIRFTVSSTKWPDPEVLLE